MMNIQRIFLTIVSFISYIGLASSGITECAGKAPGPDFPGPPSAPVGDPGPSDVPGSTFIPRKPIL